jgi:hypothetical protein
MPCTGFTVLLADLRLDRRTHHLLFVNTLAAHLDARRQPSVFGVRLGLLDQFAAMCEK